MKFATCVRPSPTSACPRSGSGSRILAALALLAAPIWAQGTITAFGVPHTPLGGATLQWNPAARELSVANIGSSGQDGVEIAVAGSDGWHAFAHGAPLVVPAGGPAVRRIVARRDDS